MAKPIIFLWLILSVISISGSTSAKHFNSKAYIESSCRTTLYPSLCVRSLTRYAGRHTIENPQTLARLSLKVSLYKAESTKSFILNVSETLKTLKNPPKKAVGAIKDCLVQIKDSVDQLSLAISELRHVDVEDRVENLGWHISNVETWTSTALTDAVTCMDAFPGRRMSKMKAMVKGKVKNVAEVTSNALNLFHRYANARYRRAATKKP